MVFEHWTRIETGRQSPTPLGRAFGAETEVHVRGQFAMIFSRFPSRFAAELAFVTEEYSEEFHTEAVTHELAFAGGTAEEEETVMAQFMARPVLASTVAALVIG